jgi:hypothetical protein
MSSHRQHLHSICNKRRVIPGYILNVFPSVLFKKISSALNDFVVHTVHIVILGIIYFCFCKHWGPEINVVPWFTWGEQKREVQWFGDLFKQKGWNGFTITTKNNNLIIYSCAYTQSNLSVTLLTLNQWHAICETTAETLSYFLRIRLVALWCPLYLLIFFLFICLLIVPSLNQSFSAVCVGNLVWWRSGGLYVTGCDAFDLAARVLYYEQAYQTLKWVTHHPSFEKKCLGNCIKVLVILRVKVSVQLKVTTTRNMVSLYIVGFQSNMSIIPSCMILEQWFLTFLALLPLELANKAIITPILNDIWEKGKSRKTNKIIFYSHNLYLHSKRFVESQYSVVRSLPQKQPELPLGGGGS